MIRTAFQFFVIGIFVFTFSACSDPQPAASGDKKESVSKSEQVKKEKVVSKDPTPVPGGSLKQVWETDPVFKIPESVLYDQERNHLYVSNIDGKSSEKDGKGFISLLNTDGSVKELEWVTGISAPKGMGLNDGLLYVTDIDELVVIDVEKATILSRIKAEGAVFLNDIAIDQGGKVFITDMGANRIYHHEKGGNLVEVWSEAEELVSCNGLLMDRGYLLVGTKDALLQMDRTSGEVTVLAEGTGPIDGLRSDGRGNYLISHWSGSVYIVRPGGKKAQLADVSSQNINTADIEFLPNEGLILIPSFMHNRILAWKN